MASGSPTATEIETLIQECHPDVRAVVAYWRRKADGRPIPSRADIDPAELTPYLPHLTLVDVVPDARRFVYRLVGTADVAIRGFDPTGKSVGEAFFGPNAEAAYDHYQYVLDHRAPYCYRGEFVAPDGAVENEDVVFLPLSEDGETINMIMVFYHDYSDAPRVEPSSVLLRRSTRKSEEI